MASAMVLMICLMAAVDVCWAKSADVKKMVKLKMNNLFIILFWSKLLCENRLT